MQPISLSHFVEQKRTRLIAFHLYLSIQTRYQFENEEQLLNMLSLITVFYISKSSEECVVLHCTRFNTPFLTQYYINDKPLTVVDLYIKLHVMESSYIHTITNKVIRTLNFIKHTLSKCSNDVTNHSILYTS